MVQATSENDVPKRDHLGAEWQTEYRKHMEFAAAIRRAAISECAAIAMDYSERYAEAARGFSQGENPMYIQGQADVLKWLAEKLRVLS